MIWFRFYNEVLNDPKCQRLAPALFKHWVNLLCLANQEPTRGTLPAIPDIAFALRLTEPKVQKILSDLTEAGLLDPVDDETLQMHGWSSRQRVSDDVAQRVSKHRERNDPEPLPKQKSNVTDTLPHARATEADTDTDTEKGINPPNPPETVKSQTIHEQRFDQFWTAYPKRVGKDAARRWWLKAKPDAALLATMLNAIEVQKLSPQWCRDGGQFIPNPATWLGQGRWNDEPHVDVPASGARASPAPSEIPRDEFPEDGGLAVWREMQRRSGDRRGTREVTP